MITKNALLSAYTDNEEVDYSTTILASRWGWHTTIYPKDSTETQRTFGLFSVKQRNDVHNSVYVRDAKSNDSYEIHYIATQEWVNLQIQGAITASY